MYIVETTNFVESEIVANTLLKDVDVVNYMGIELTGVQAISVSEHHTNRDAVTVMLTFNEAQYAAIDYDPNEAECRLSTMTIDGQKYLNIFIKSE